MGEAIITRRGGGGGGIKREYIELFASPTNTSNSMTINYNGELIYIVANCQGRTWTEFEPSDKMPEIFLTDGSYAITNVTSNRTWQPGGVTYGLLQVDTSAKTISINISAGTDGDWNPWYAKFFAEIITEE